MVINIKIFKFAHISKQNSQTRIFSFINQDFTLDPKRASKDTVLIDAVLVANQFLSHILAEGCFSQIFDVNASLSSKKLKDVSVEFALEDDWDPRPRIPVVL
jgi:hypothetical protein